MNATAKKLLKAIESQKATLAILGLGYVGLPLAVAFARRGFQVWGIDVDPERVDSITRGISYVEDIPSRDLGRVVKAGRLNM